MFMAHVACKTAHAHRTKRHGSGAENNPTVDEAEVLAHQTAGYNDGIKDYEGQPSNADIRFEAVKKSASELDESRVKETDNSIDAAFGVGDSEGQRRCRDGFAQGRRLCQCADPGAHR